MLARKYLPSLTPVNSFFWQGGEWGELRIQHCDRCGHWNHPPTESCPVCLDASPQPRRMSGFARLEAYTVNHQPWWPGLAVPYVIGIVSLEDCPQIQLTTNIVGIAPAAVGIGMRLRCTFEHCADVWLPLFTPV